MRNKMGDEQRLVHILEAIEEILSYNQNIEFNTFKSHSMIRFASIKQIEIIGEAAKNISEETRKKYPDIEWKQISGLRNILVHEYFGVDSELIWQIIQVDIPILKKSLAKS